MNEPRILLAHASAAVLLNLSDELRRRRARAEVSGVQTGALLIQRQCFRPAGVILVDLAFPEIERIWAWLRHDPMGPRLYACSDADSEAALPGFVRESADGCGLRGTPVGAMADELMGLLESGLAPEQRAVARVRQRETLQRLLFQAGVSPHLKGGRCLRLALEMIADDPRLLDSLEGRLYPALALRCGGTADNVERSMRYAAAQLWQRMEPAERLRLLPRCHAAPGCKRLLTALADRLSEAESFSRAVSEPASAMRMATTLMSSR